jgi:hypothetical protein
MAKNVPSSLKNEALFFSEASVSLCKFTWHHILGDGIIGSYCCETLNLTQTFGILK